MATIIPVGYGTCAWYFNCIGRTRNYAVTSGFQPAVPITDANAMATALSNSFTAVGSPAGSLGNILDSYTYLGTVVTFMTGTGPVGGAHSVAITGSATPGGMPPNAAYIVRKFTGRGGRQGRGRMYSPPFNLSELSVDSTGHLSGGTITALSAQWESFRALCDTNLVPLVLLHDTPKVGTAPAPDTITSLVVEAQVGTQRRRLRN